MGADSARGARLWIWIFLMFEQTPWNLRNIHQLIWENLMLSFKCWLTLMYHGNYFWQAAFSKIENSFLKWRGTTLFTVIFIFFKLVLAFLYWFRLRLVQFRRFPEVLRKIQKYKMVDPRWPPFENHDFIITSYDIFNSSFPHQRKHLWRCYLSSKSHCHSSYTCGPRRKKKTGLDRVNTLYTSAEALKFKFKKNHDTVNHCKPVSLTLLASK